MMNALGAAQPPPNTAHGSLNSIAAIGAAPVTMQNKHLRQSECIACEPVHRVDNFLRGLHDHLPFQRWGAARERGVA